MLLLRRAVSALTVTALTCGLTALSVGSAEAVTPAERCAAAGAVVTSAQQDHATSVAALKKSKAKVTKVKGKLKAARASQATVRAASLKKKLAAAKSASKAKKNAFAMTGMKLQNAKDKVPYACAQQTGDPLTQAQFTEVLSVLESAGLNGAFNPQHVLDLVMALFPDEFDALTVPQLTLLMDSLNSFDLGQLQNLAGLVGGFGDLLSPAQVTSMIETITNLFSTLPLGGQFSPTEMAGIVAVLMGQFTSQLDTFGLGALGDVLQLLLTALGSGGDLAGFDLTDLTSILDQLLPGVSDQLSPSQLTSLLGLVTTGSLDPMTVLGLLGDGFSPTDLLALLTASASPELLQGLIGQILPQLGALGGVPAGGNPTAILSGLTTLLDDLLGGVLCTLLPILCP